MSNIKSSIALLAFLLLGSMLKAQAPRFTDSLAYKDAITKFCNIYLITDDKKENMIDCYRKHDIRLTELNKTPRTINSRGHEAISDVEIQLRIQNSYKLMNELIEILGKKLFKEFEKYSFTYKEELREQRAMQRGKDK